MTTNGTKCQECSHVYHKTCCNNQLIGLPLRLENGRSTFVIDYDREFEAFRDGDIHNVLFYNTNVSSAQLQPYGRQPYGLPEQQHIQSVDNTSQWPPLIDSVAMIFFDTRRPSSSIVTWSSYDENVTCGVLPLCE